MRWDLYSALTTALGNLTFLVRDDGEALPENQIKRMTMTTLESLLGVTFPRKYIGKTTAPGVGDASVDGYAVGDRWIDETNDKEYVALDVSVGAAVWTETTATGGTGGVTSGPQSFGDNYVITPSVASNNLTVALKTIAGADPSAGDKITFRIGNTKREITAAASYTKNAATNWHNAGSAELAGKPIDFFVYAIQETGASAGTKFGHSRIPYALTMADFVNTTTDEKYIAGNWTNFNATDQVEVIGRFRAQLSAGAGYTWSIASALVINRPIYETDFLEWTPQHTGFTATIPSGGVTRYILSGKLLQLNYAHPTPGASNATNLLISSPFKSKNLTGYNQWFALGFTYDNSIGVATGQAQMAPNSNSIICSKSIGAVWTASGNKLANFTLFVEIN
jgi:hypothetical protein